ncbi:type IV secretory system conjugative DNA transfer family protein [Flavobacterium psychrophilum]|uniref:type IV secretory system conjugative DNA transfer family protein n=1 Tax=Flavobacterium psychrophilum TaxID=96345 RepID=UPI000B7C30D3|nr:type IV secretory system conjugative DNA transfer family protein [Flavobacterium psychrophilum]SNA84333.1 putative mobilization protein, TraG family [Flavobacterium psychrophilum]
MQGIGLNDITSPLQLVFKLIKVIFIYVTFISVILNETHLLFFGIANLFVDKYGFQLQNSEANPSFISREYNNFLYHFCIIMEKMSAFESIVGVLLISSIIYISYFYCKSKKFPRVIVGTLINNTIFIFIFIILFSFIGSSFNAHKEEITFGLIIVIILYSAYLLKFKGKNKKSGKAIFEKGKNKKSEKENLDGFVFETKSGKVFLDNPYRGIYIQGGAGSGKSASLFEPIITQCGEKQFTGMLYDFKSPELTNLVYLSYQNTNIKVKNVDFKNPLTSDRVNPIHPKYLTKSAVAMELSTVIINNLSAESIKKMDYWNSNFKQVLAGVIWFLKNDYPEFCTLPHAISLILHNPIEEVIRKVSQNFESAGFVASLLQSIELGSDKTTAGIVSTIQNSLSMLNTHEMFWILSANDVDLHLNNKENPTFLCLGNDSTLPTTYTPAISLIISVALRQMNQPDQQKSVVLLDESPTVFIPNIEQIPATARSNKIATIFGVQDFAQLADKYGNEKAQVIISNLGNQFFGRITNGKTAEMVQNLFSKKDEIFISKNDGTGTSGQFVHLGSNTNAGTSEAVQERDRVKISDLVNLCQGEFFGIIAEGTPREFLKTQFLQAKIKGEYINTKIPVNAQIMEDNYMRIIEECKTIIE